MRFVISLAGCSSEATSVVVFYGDNMKLRCPVCGFDLYPDEPVKADGIVTESPFVVCRFCNVKYFKFEVAQDPINGGDKPIHVDKSS